MLEDIGTNPFHLTETARQFVADLGDPGHVNLFVAGPTLYEDVVRNVLQKENTIVDVVSPLVRPADVNGSCESSEVIAIVGMAGRFPGGGDLQQFWEILLQERDVHEKVSF